MKILNNNPYCCIPLENLINNAGERGFSALVLRSFGKLNIVLQMRAISYNDIDNYQKGPFPQHVTYITLSGSLFLGHCPYCGYKINNLLDNNAIFFESLLEKHKIFQVNESALPEY